MCGVVGFIHLDQKPATKEVLQKMTDEVAHRGPDGEGHYIEGAFGLGHRRLAILDPTPAGHQPMITKDGRYVISYNGEVYNFKDLRAELEALGYSFRSQSDTEVVLYAYAEWKEKALDRFNGMFAFAIWDKKEKQLFIARDRYGIKPLYYYAENDILIFGSEIKSILKHPSVRSKVDKEALLEYFTFQNIFTDKTLFQGIQLFPQGSYAILKMNNTKSLDVIKYWDYHFQEPAKAESEKEYIEELDRLFKQAVKRQLVSDVDVGSYLSGGMDSGSITAIAAKELPYLRTFTCGFDLRSASGIELAFDEREKAERMSYLFKTEHYEAVLKSGDMERVMGPLVWHLEDLRVGQSYPNYYASQLASKFVTVVLAGTGGDELFGGYPWRYYRAVSNDNFDHYIDKYYVFWQRLISNKPLQQAFKPIWNEVKDVWTRDIFKNVFQQPVDNIKKPEEYVNLSLYLEAKTFLHGLLLVEDKLSMAHSLEVRVPFLDNDLVDFAMQLPVQFKLNNLKEITRINENTTGSKTKKYFKKTNDGKLLLRKMMRRYIPSEITDAVKQGFSAPDSSWFKGESIDYVREMLFSSSARIYEYLDRATIESMVKQHLEGRENRRLLIWSLLSYEHWLRKFLV